MKVQRGVGPGPTPQRKPWQPVMAWPWPCWKLSTILLSAGYMLCVHAFSPPLCFCIIGPLWYTWSMKDADGGPTRHGPLTIPTTPPCHSQLDEKEGTSWRNTVEGKWYLWNTQLPLLPLSMPFCLPWCLFFFLTLLEPSSFLPFTCGF